MTTPTEPPPSDGTVRQRNEAVSLLEDIIVAKLAIDATEALLGSALRPFRVGTKAISMAWRELRVGRWHAPVDQKLINKYTAWFLLNSAIRIQRGISSGMALKEIKNTEQRFVQQHLAAQKSRVLAYQDSAFAAAQATAMVGKPMLKWVYNEEYKDCSPINGVVCKDLNGTIFDFRKPPQGLLPGQRHPHCQCKSAPVLSL